MSWLRGLRQRIGEMVRPGRTAAELDEELQDHLAREVDRQLRDGVSPDDARRRARLRAGSLETAREAVRDDLAGRFLRETLADVRVAARAARRNPGFSLAVVLSLALGVGGTTSVFSIVNAVLLRPLPYEDPDRLFVVRIWWNDFSSSFSPADFLAVQEEGAGLARVGAYFLPNNGFAMGTPAGPEVVDGAIVTADLPRVLGIPPILGPGFSTRLNAPEAVISESLWRGRYDVSPAVLGRGIVLDGDAYTIVGVMPSGFNVPGQRRGAAWLRALDWQPTRRGAFYLTAIARLDPGVAGETAAARFTAAVTPILRDRYGTEPTWRYGFEPLKETLVGDVRSTLLLLLGAVGLVLLIAVVNVSNLMLARSTVRARELAVRASLGAGRARLVRHLLAESALLGSVGGALGVALAWSLLRLIGASALDVLPRVEGLELDAVMVLFAVACGIGAGLVAGILPAGRLPWTRPAGFLREAGPVAGGVPAHARMRQGLVIAEIALTVTVLTAAVLLTKSLLRLQAVDPGFRPAGVVTFRLSLPEDPYATGERRAAFLADLDEQLRADARVSSAAFSLALPPDLLVLSNNYTVEGGTPGAAGSDGVAEWQVVTPEYFDAMGIRLLGGRGFTVDDRSQAPLAAIVNESFVRRHYPGGQAVGSRLKGGEFDPAAPWTTIVGVVADVAYGKGVWGGAEPTVYLPFAQNLWVESPYVILKAGDHSAGLLAAAQQAVRAIDPNLPLRDYATMEQRLRSSMLEPRLRSVLFACIAGLALALAVTGIYGVMAYHVSQRRRETAIRRALGAGSRNVVAGLLGMGLRLALMGILVGAAGAMAVTRSLSAVLFHVSPHDPAAFLTVAGLLASCAALATAVPALRTLRIDPASVLRDE